MLTKADCLRVRNYFDGTGVEPVALTVTCSCSFLNGLNQSVSVHVSISRGSDIYTILLTTDIPAVSGRYQGWCEEYVHLCNEGACGFTVTTSEHKGNLYLKKTAMLGNQSYAEGLVSSIEKEVTDVIGVHSGLCDMHTNAQMYSKPEEVFAQLQATLL
jgi:hypothetical protein